MRFRYRAGELFVQPVADKTGWIVGVVNIAGRRVHDGARVNARVNEFCPAVADRCYTVVTGLNLSGKVAGQGVDPVGEVGVDEVVGGFVFAHKPQAHHAIG